MNRSHSDEIKTSRNPAFAPAREVLELTVPPDQPPLSLGQFLRKTVRLTKRQISSLKFRENGILLNGCRARTDARVKAGDLVSLRLNVADGRPAQGVRDGAETLRAAEGTSGDPALADLPEILYEDCDLLIADKPPGIVCHPAGAHCGDSLAEQILRYAKLHGEIWTARLIGRLDRDASGAVLFAKSAEAAAFLSRASAVRKLYLGIAEGIPREEAGEICLPLAPDPSRFGTMKTDPAGRPAETRYRIVRIGEARASGSGRADGSADAPCMLAVRIRHGRTHQIRVHLASIGHPLFGDPLYGSGTAGATRAMLHCREISLIRPFTQETFTVTAPYPSDWPAEFRVTDPLPDPPYLPL